MALEAQPLWYKSSFCQNENGCVEVAVQEGLVLTRDSKDPSGAVLDFSPSAWNEFLAALVAGELGGS